MKGCLQNSLNINCYRPTSSVSQLPNIMSNRTFLKLSPNQKNYVKYASPQKNVQNNIPRR